MYPLLSTRRVHQDGSSLTLRRVILVFMITALRAGSDLLSASGKACLRRRSVDRHGTPGGAANETRLWQLTMVPTVRVMPRPQYVFGTMSPYPMLRRVMATSHMAFNKLAWSSSWNLTGRENTPMLHHVSFRDHGSFWLIVCDPLNPFRWARPYRNLSP